ncbi:MAG: YHS domain-containing protein [Planctomycetota bacterium]|jgi:YHS domain-containing protein
MEGNPIKKEYFVEYKGKKVYFCCPGCDKKFLANPEQYIAKLPQFNQ